MTSSMSVAVSRGPRLTARACLAALLTLPAALMLVLVGQAPARSATVGTLVVTPGTGTTSAISTFTTSGTCPDGDGLTLKVYGGSGTGSVIAVPLSQLSPKNMNGAIDAAGFVDGTGMTIQASQTWRDFATTGSPALAALNGVYTVRAWCSSGDWYEGQLAFDGATGTYTTSAAPTTTSAAPTTTSPAPTTTSAAPTTTSPAPTTTSAAPTTTSPAPTTTSAAPTTTSPAPTTTSPAPTPTSAAPTTSSAGPTTSQPAPTTAAPAPTSSPTLAPTPLPTAPPAPGGALGVGIDGNGAFIAPGSTLERGDTVTVVASGFGRGELLKYSVFSQELVFGYGYADTAGATTYTFVVPSELADGAHRFVVSGAARVVVFPFVVGKHRSVPASSAPAPSGSSSGSAGNGAGSPATQAADAELADTGGSAPGLVWSLAVAVLLLIAGSHLIVRPQGGAAGQHATRSRGRHQS